MKSHVPTLDTCKKLKEAGFKDTHYNKFFLKSCKTYPAPLATELLEVLPKKIEHKYGEMVLHISHQDIYYIALLSPMKLFVTPLTDNLAEDLSQLYLKLAQENLI